MGTPGPKRIGPNAYFRKRIERGALKLPDDVDQHEPGEWIAGQIVALMNGDHEDCHDVVNERDENGETRQRVEVLRYPISRACRRFLPYETLREWDKYAVADRDDAVEYAEFIAAIARAQDRAIARRIARGEDASNWGWHKFILGNMAPEFRETTRSEVTGKDGGPIETTALTAEDRAKHAAVIEGYRNRDKP